MRVLLLAALLLGAAAAPAHGAPPTLFPSDRLTVADPAQVTGKRVNLPLPDCSAQPSDCNDVRLLNELDGFDLDPRVAIGFGRPIDVGKVTPDTVFLQPVAGGERIGLARLVFSPARNTLFGSPARQLREATEYRLVVGAALSGEGAETTFTTMTASAGLRQMREQLDDGSAYDAAGIPPASRGLSFLDEGRRTVFAAPSVTRIQRFNDKGAGEPSGELVPNSAAGGAGLYAFGSFQSPSWLTADRAIPATPTKAGRPKVTGSETVGFTLIVPAQSKPPGGYPVAIFGPGITRSKFDVFLAADENASRGIATMAIDPVGHGFGPRSATEVTTSVPPGQTRFSAFGRGRDLDSDGTITQQEGVQTPGQPAPLASVGLRDGLRQTALDNMALVRAIGRGVDVDGDGAEDLRRDGVTYYAQSLGGIYGTMLMAVDPQVRAGVLNVPGGPILEIARLSPSFRSVVADELKHRRPPAANGGREGFTESTPLFGEPPITAPAQGAVTIQEIGAGVNWLNRPGSPETFAPLLDPAGKQVIYQFALGDATVPNPTSATVMRAGNLESRTTVYRNDRTPTASSNPHGFLLDPRFPAGRNPAQRQILDFLASGGATVTDPDGGGAVFEVPVADPRILEKLNFQVPPASGEPPAETAADGPGSDAGTGPGTGDKPGGGGGDKGSGSKRRGRLRVKVSPRRFRAGRRVTLRVRVRRAGRPVRRATIRFAGKRARTGGRGRARLRVRVRRPGLRRVAVRAPAGDRKRVQIRVRRRR